MSHSRCYLAGPMRSVERSNRPAAAEATRRLRAAGWTVVSPWEMDEAEARERGESMRWEDWPTMPDWMTLENCLRRDFAAILDVDCMILLPGWETSEGVAKELRVALDVGKDVLFYREDDKSDAGFTLVPQVTAVEDPYYAVWPAGTGCQFTPLPPATIITDPVTGGQKGQKECQLSAVDPVALEALGRVAGMGAAKYSRANYLKGFAWSLAMDALLRHFLEFASGNTYDEESGINHMAHTAWQALCLVSFAERGLGTDDRLTR